MPKWQDFLLARGRYHKYQLDFAKKSKIDWGAKILCHFFWFQFLGSAGPKNGRIKKKWVANFFYYYCVIMRPKLKKIAYIALAKNLIFHFFSKNPILTKNGSPAPQGGQRKKSLACIKKLSNNNSYKPIKKHSKIFLARSCRYLCAKIC